VHRKNIYQFGVVMHMNNFNMVHISEWPNMCVMVTKYLWVNDVLQTFSGGKNNSIAFWVWNVAINQRLHLPITVSTWLKQVGMWTVSLFPGVVNWFNPTPVLQQEVSRIEGDWGIHSISCRQNTWILINDTIKHLRKQFYKMHYMKK
jgi:hypothetical protein